MDYNKIFLYLLVSLLISLPLCLVKYYINTNNFIIILFTMILYSLTLYLYYKILLKKDNISKFGPIISILSVIFVVIFGIFFFNEKLRIYTVSGIILSLLSIYLLSIK